MKFPKTKTIDVVCNLHGVEVTDSYRWLETESEERSVWIKEQNAHTDAHLQDFSEAQGLRMRLEELLKVETISGPSILENGRMFFYRQHPDEQHSVLYTKQWPDGEESVVLNPNEWSEDGSLAILSTSVTRDGKLIAYAQNKEGSDWGEWFIADVDSGEIIDKLPRLAYTSVSWLPDNSGFFYNRTEGTDSEKFTKNDHRVFFHKLGEDWKDDVKIFGDGYGVREHPTFGSVSKDGKHGTIYVSKGWGDEELFYMNLETGDIELLTKGMKGEFRTSFKNGKMYILHNHDAPNFTLCAVDLNDGIPSPDKWKTLIADNKERVLLDYSVLETRLFASHSVNVVEDVWEYDLDGAPVRQINLPTLGSVSVPWGQEGLDAVFLSFESFFHPNTVYSLNLETAQLKEYSRNNYPVDSSAFITEQLWFQSKDGTEVPMFVCRHKDTPIDGNNKTILYGYGGFNISLTPQFAPSKILWLERGGVYVIANLRGGAEFGEGWHEAGMRQNKQNVFDDFIAAGEALIGERPSRRTGEREYSILAYTNRDQLGISGGSNGGLLTGAVLVQQPELWGAVEVEVPLLDMLRFHFTEGGKYWVSEYGDPDVAEDFQFIYSYSPYHNVQKGVAYPPTIFKTALGDDRGVDPMHAMKMAAYVQSANSSENPILLRVQEKTGHGHSKPLNMVIDELVEKYSFFEIYLKK